MLLNKMTNTPQRAALVIFNTLLKKLVVTNTNKTTSIFKRPGKI